MNHTNLCILPTPGSKEDLRNCFLLSGGTFPESRSILRKMTPQFRHPHQQINQHVGDAGAQNEEDWASVPVRGSDDPTQLGHGDHKLSSQHGQISCMRPRNRARAHTKQQILVPIRDRNSTLKVENIHAPWQNPKHFPNSRTSMRSRQIMSLG